MEWFYTKKRGPQWKQGWTGQTLASVSSPPLPLLTIFGIVVLLLWLSQYTDYKAQIHHSMINFQLFIFLLPILLIFVLAANLTSGSFNFGLWRPGQQTFHQAGGAPFGVAILLIVLLVLLSYQSSFHSKWFGPLWRSN